VPIRPSPIPPQVARAAFTVGEGLEAGLSARRLRAADLDRSYWGVRSATQAGTLGDRCLLLRRRMPDDAFFSHTTAALLLGIPVPLAAETDAVLHVSVVDPHRAPHARGLAGHRVSMDGIDIVERGGLRLTAAARTWCDLADLFTLPDLVAAGDHIIHWRQPLASREQLELAVASRVGRRGLKVLRLALRMLSDRAESPPESQLRVLLLLAGFAEPRVNHAVTDRFGEFVGRTDLILDAEKIILEYQGDYHRPGKRQWRADMTRRSRLEALGWRVMELNADDLKDPEELVARIRAVAALPRAS
jgi:very-short-patch-repair endonuclease